MEPEVIFDREDRLYKFGEVISGKIVVRSKSDCIYSKIWITYSWWTHGRGMRNYGYPNELVLSQKETFISAGEKMDFLFSFPSPDKPLTYHGHYLNVDWRVTAHVETSSGKVFKSEQDFLLLRSDPIKESTLGYLARGEANYISGNQMMDNNATDFLEVKEKSKTILTFAFNLLYFLFVVILFLCLDYFDKTKSGWALMVFPAGLVLRYYLPKTIRKLSKKKVTLGSLSVKPRIAHSGSQVYCHLDFRINGNAYLKNIKFSTFVEERVTRIYYTNNITEFHVIHQNSYVKPYQEHFSDGKIVSLICPIPIAEDAPATFSSMNNRLDWYVKVQVRLKGWPDWVEILPITVLP